MFGSVYGETPEMRMQSKSIRMTATPRTSNTGQSIYLDFLKSKRSSFLPHTWEEGNVTSDDSSRRASSHTYEGATAADEKQKTAIKKFCTGSKYFGSFNGIGMVGKGIYKFPHGVIYDGYFNKQGEFHGTGTLIYPGGQRVEGLWRNGKLVQRPNCVSKDNASFNSQYCKMPDRRFQIEVRNEVMPAGQEYLTNESSPREIPPGMYDTVEGFYDPQHRVVIDYRDPSKKKTVVEMCDEVKQVYMKLLESTSSHMALMETIAKRPIMGTSTIDSVPANEEEQWIRDNCRKAWDEPTGYRKDLYEMWTSGYKEESNQITEKLIRRSYSDDEVIRRLSRIEHQQPEKTTNMYSFITNYVQMTQKKLANESNRSSVREFSSIFLPLGDPKSPLTLTQRKILREEKKYRKLRSGTSTPAPSIHGYKGSSYKHLMLHKKRPKKIVEEPT